jgi:hypothetical protein
MEGRNVRFETRWTGGDPTRMRRLAAEIVSLTPEVIMNGGLPTLVAMQQETHTILAKFNVPEAEHRELFAIVQSTKGDIVSPSS